MYTPLFIVVKNKTIGSVTTMKLKSTAIINRINSDFSSAYRPFSKFPNSGALWEDCINTVKDSKLMNNIIFCNDVLQIPPVKVFIAAKNITMVLSNADKKAIGAFWGFVFKFVFKYKNQKSLAIKINSVKNATYFFDGPKNTEVIKG
jgi:hypothetical protein